MKRYLLLLPLLLLGGWVAQLPVSAPSFTGIGDVSATGVVGHYGSVAFSAASRGSKMYRICDVVDSVCTGGTAKDISSDATTGLVSSTQGVGTIATCGTGANTCFIMVAYDDSGSGPDMTPIGSPSPPFIPNAIGTLPGIGCQVSTPPRLIEITTVGTSGPIYQIATLNSTATITTWTTPLAMEGGGSGGWFFANSSSRADYKRLNTGFTITQVFTGGQTYAIIAGDDGAANGHLFIDGTDNTGTVGTGATNGSTSFCGVGSGLDLAGFTTELAFYHADLASSAAAMNTVVHTNNGF